MIRVFICDDHKLVVEGVELMLAELPDIQYVGSAATGEAVLEIAQTDTGWCDVLLLDINLPGKNGIEICKQLRQLVPDCRILALSMLKELSLVKLMLKNGANGYLVKNAGKEEIQEAIRMVMEGRRYVDEELKELMMDSLEDALPKHNYGPLPSLSRREKEVLALIMDEHTAPEIAGKLFISTGTVETHRRNMLSKLGARNTAGLVRMAMEYKLLDD